MLDKQKNQGILKPYLRNVNVRWGKFDLSDMLKMPFEDNEDERYSICQNDLVVCEGGEPGRCAIWTDTDPIKFQKALHRVRVNDGILNKYIQIILKTFCTNGMIEGYYTGSTIKHLTGDSLNSILFPLPPTKEQLRIVDEVERWENVMDILTKESDELTTAILQVKSRILDLAFHGKLVPQGPNDEPAIEILKRINPKFTPCDNAQYQYDIPYNWEWSNLGSIGKWQSGGTPDRKNKLYYNGEIPWLKIADLQDDYVIEATEFISEDGLNNSSAKYNPTGSVALAMYGSIGKVGILTFPSTTNQAICVCSDYIITQKYLFYYLISQRDNFFMLSGGGVQANISKQIIVKHPIPIPPHSEQLRIVAKIEDLFAVLDEIRESIEA